MTTIPIIRSNLKRLILSEYPSVEKFAHEHDLDKSTLSRILGGKREPKISTLLKIAKALGIGVDAICGHEAIGPATDESGNVVLKCGAVQLVAHGEDGRRLLTLTSGPGISRIAIRLVEPTV